MNASTYTQYVIPAIISFFGILITVGVNFWLGSAKQEIESKSVAISAEGDLRDDLLALVARYENQLAQKEQQIQARDERLEKRDMQIRQSQEVIAQQLEKITELTLTTKALQFEVKELRAELDKFNKKVYYIRELTKDESGDKKE